MGETIELESPAERRHIIERPRLTRLLDATSARVIMLVAPAGYGKTTLARQWLSKRPHAWYQAKPASADVAALSVALAGSLAELAPSVARQLSERLRATQDATQEIAVLAEIQSEAISDWPDGAWLVIDDYQFLANSEAAETYIDALLSSTSLRLLLTSRARPCWATSRRLLYGELYELGRAPLSMSENEAESVFAKPGRQGLPGLVALAEGWPAVIGLAALTDADHLPGALPETLYEFLADELYQVASGPLQRALPELALAPRLTHQLLDFLFGSRKATRLLAEASRLGFLSTTPGEPELHPLHRTFLLRKLADGAAAENALAARRIASFLLEHDRWDDLFDLLQRFPLPDVLVTLFESAYEEMLRNGRLSTLEEWLDAASRLKLKAPVLDIARAEVALRQGAVGRAEALSLLIARRSKVPKDVRCRAFCVAGQAAHLNNRDEASFQRYQKAQLLAQDPANKRDAIWGQLISARVLRREEALHELLSSFLTDEPTGADEVLRAANAQISVASRIGGLPTALETALSAHSVLEEAVDPLIRTSFLNSLGRTLSLLARYDEAAGVADQEILDATQTRLTFVLPHAYVAKAVAELGLRHFGEAESALTAADRIAKDIGDTHNLFDVQTVRCKLAITTKDFERALSMAVARQWNELPTSEMLAEHEAARALALACANREGEARAAAGEAETLSMVPEIAGLVACVRAVCALTRGEDAASHHAVSQALDSMCDLGVFDPLVIACRAYPPFIPRALASARHSDTLLQVLSRTRDVGLEKPGAELDSNASASVLSRREAEVLDLLTLGYTNREIASALYIAEVTVKVHVRHILKKLGVRSRTEAVLVTLRRDATDS